ncbi:uncharacterized protein KIAA1522 homolog isoform X2 [Cololabis saira]|uniref:uncharacterized protein KIAA1522 homolog isoform X2 n=1 Tax=Cololabis saira TaxID=129043 RepID=UPI002AD3ECB8|nr:uncharacterized protein KIAA1522 homolog isoform X2 [Cololabis saira]
MSRRRSTGDLVPKDITEILAREARAQRGQKKQGSSLGQAFSWLRGSRRKKSLGNGLNCTFTGITDAKPGLQNQDAAKAGPKENEGQKRLAVHYTASQHYQENVFIEGSRSQYLEDLHTEAQEGLKILQQEEHKNGVNFPDDESIASTDTLRPEQYVSFNDGACSPESSSSTGNPDGTLTSAVMTQPPLTHQGSTFKPPNPVKRLDRSRKRSRRTTIMGIPNQVQKELALHRSSTFQPLVSTQLPDHNKNDMHDGQSGVVIIPTVDGGAPVVNKEGARVHLSELEAFRDEELKRHLQAVYKDEHNHQDFGSHLCPSSIRPKSLAVPGMTTSFSISPSMFNFLHEPQGPVMSISPQATYLSTIIPNAVLPAAVEVIEIDRSTSRTRGSSVNHGGSDRAVSKSSLTSGDSSVTPVLSRSSDDDGSQNNTSHNNSTLMTSSPSGSNWSEAQSSKMIISHSSPALSKRGGLNVQDSKSERSEDQDLVSLRSVVSAMSNLSNTGDNGAEHGSGCGAPESAAAGDQAKDKRNFTRSLSVLKTKQPPAPPRRTNSLHGKKIRNEARLVVQIKDLGDSASEKTSTEKNSVEDNQMLAQTNTRGICTPVSNSTGSSCEGSPSQASSPQTGGVTESLLESCTSSPLKTPPDGEKFERTMSPSSGYSSQSGTPTLSPKEISPTSPDQQKKKPVKPERSGSRASSSAASASSSLTSLSSGTSELANPDVSMCSSTLSPQESLPTIATKDLTCNNNPSHFGVEIRDLLNIPPPPKVKAPCPPPPETWAHNRHTVEFLCGPFPNVSKEAQKPTQIQETTIKQADTQTETGKNGQIEDENQTKVGEPALEMSESKTKPEESSAMNHRGADMEDELKDCPVIEQIQQEEKQNTCSMSAVKEPEPQEKTPKKDPPPVMKKPLAVLHRKATTKQPLETQPMELGGSAATEVDAASQSPVTVVVEESEMDGGEVPSLQTLPSELPKMNKISPPPTPPPTYHPTPPLSRKPHPLSGSIPANELQRVQEELHAVESCWPPPPPPLDGESAFEGEDDADFPPPPPPLVTDTCIKVLDLPEEQIVENQDVPQTISRPAATDGEPLADGQNSDGGASCPLVQNIATDGVTPPSVESPPVPPVTRAESPVSAMALPHCDFMKRNSLKADDQSPSAPPVSPQPPAPPIVPVAPPPPTENLTHGVNFRRQPSGAYRDTRSKELLSRHKSALIPKEDANIPLVTPSLLQMVRLRSVSVTEDEVKAPSEDKSTAEKDPVQENCPVSIQGLQNIPQKPIRKSLSLKSPPQTVKASSVTLNSPSTRMQEAIRMKTAAMSSRDCLPSRLGVKSASYSCTSESGAPALKAPESSDVHKSPASTASFIFSRSTKKVVIDTAAASPEAQASLKQSLAAELMQVSEQSKAAAFSNGAVKCDKVPPPVAKKPTHSSMSPSHNSQSSSAKMELSAEGNGAIGGMQHTPALASPETMTRVTADTIETLF